MVIINVPCDDPGCDGSVRFNPGLAPHRVHRQFGSCDTCQTRYTLYGGQLTVLPDPCTTSLDPQARPTLTPPLLAS